MNIKTIPIKKIKDPTTLDAELQFFQRKALVLQNSLKRMSSNVEKKAQWKQELQFFISKVPTYQAHLLLNQLEQNYLISRVIDDIRKVTNEIDQKLSDYYQIELLNSIREHQQGNGLSRKLFNASLRAKDRNVLLPATKMGIFSNKNDAHEQQEKAQLRLSLKNFLPRMPESHFNNFVKKLWNTRGALQYNVNTFTRDLIEAFQETFAEIKMQPSDGTCFEFTFFALIKFFQKQRIEENKNTFLCLFERIKDKVKLSVHDQAINNRQTLMRCYDLAIRKTLWNESQTAWLIEGLSHKNDASIVPVQALP